jgi:transcriptional regulator with XRE-family HTH domain
MRTQQVTCLHDGLCGPRLLSNVKTIGGNIRALMVDAGIRTQAELATKLGVSQPQASDWVNDRYEWKDARLGTLVRIAVALGAPLEALLAGTELGVTSPVIAASTNGPSKKEGADGGTRALDPELLERIERVEATLLAGVDELGSVRTELARLTSPRSDKRRARR